MVMELKFVIGFTLMITQALVKVALYAKDGETYNIGGHNQIKNIEVVKTLCALLEELMQKSLMVLFIMRI